MPAQHRSLTYNDTMPSAVPSFTLSFQGVEFRLDPHEIGSSFAFDHQGNGQISLRLENFTGSLQISPTADRSKAEGTAELTPEHSPVQRESRVSLSPEERTVVRPTMKKTTTTRKTVTKRAKNVSPSPSSSLASECPSSEEEKPKKRRISVERPGAKKSRVQEITSAIHVEPSNSILDEPKMEGEEPAQILTPAVDSPDDSVKPAILEETATTTVTKTSVTTTDDNDNDSRPPPRWGHTMTLMEDGNRCLIYGGQSITAPEEGKDDQGANLVTHGDLYLYDFVSGLYSKPIHCEGLERQWHSCAYVPQRQLMIAFGGEYHSTKGKVTTMNQVMVLDTEIMLWYPPTVSGNVPSARSGHTASIIAKDQMVVFGGVSGSKFQTSVAVLDTNRWKWTCPLKIEGDAPRPRSYHSATVVSKSEHKDWIVIFGGNNKDACFDSVHVLEYNDGMWSWINPIVGGNGPAPRTGHSATLMENGKTILIQGGWDPNDTEDDDAELVFDDCFFLDTSNWEWTKAYGTKAGARVGHTAVQHGDQIHVFGGRLPGGIFSNELISFAK